VALLAGRIDDVAWWSDSGGEAALATATISSVPRGKILNSRAVLSQDAVTMRLPSGLNAALSGEMLIIVKSACP
jgi:hypothetical protein